MDDLLFKKLSEKLIVIKIDVEGNEIEVLNGAKKTIEKYKLVIILEISPENRERIKRPMKKIWVYFVWVFLEDTEKFRNKV